MTDPGGSGSPQSEIAGPVSRQSRIDSLDVLRGVALLGILLINIRYTAYPLFRGLMPHPRDVAMTATDFLGWFLGTVLAEDKMIALFSMLFGAGIVLITGRAKARGDRPWWLHYRRIFWLAVIGHFHAFVIWFGDILMAYSVCAALVYPLRRLPAILLIVIGAISVSGLATYNAWPSLTRVYQEWTDSAPDQPAQRPPPTARQLQWREVLGAQQEAVTGSYADVFTWRARLNILFHHMSFHRFSIWRCGGFMLIGMGLMKLGVFSATRSRRWYLTAMAIGYPLGLALVGVGMWEPVHRLVQLEGEGQITGAAAQLVSLASADPPIDRGISSALRLIGTIPFTIAHASLIVLICKCGPLRLLTLPFAAVGRMALSNYLTHGIVMAVIFEGWALGYFNKIGYSGTFLIVLSIWLAQLIISPIWLRFFNFGPAEWVWRSLTYWSVQPMRAKLDRAEAQEHEGEN